MGMMVLYPLAHGPERIIAKVVEHVLGDGDDVEETGHERVIPRTARNGT